MIQLKTADEQDLIEIITWFDNADDVRIWGGPNMRFPLILNQLKEDLDWDNARSYSLFKDTKLVAFTQLRDKFDFHHISRVLVNQNYRGHGLGKEIMQQILALENPEQKAYSLFVYKDNEKAVSLYKKLDFQIQDDYDGPRMEDCYFMLRAHP